MRTVTALSLILAVAASVLLLVVPTYRTNSESVDESGSGPARRSITEGYATELAVNGPRVLLVLAFPILIALVPLLVPLRGVRAGATLVLGGFCLVGKFSVGLFYLPSAVTMFLAARRAEPPPNGHSAIPPRPAR